MSQKWDGGILNKTHAVRRKETGVLGRPPTMSTTEANLLTRPHLLADEGVQGSGGGERGAPRLSL